MTSLMSTILSTSRDHLLGRYERLDEAETEKLDHSPHETSAVKVGSRGSRSLCIRIALSAIVALETAVLAFVLLGAMPHSESAVHVPRPLASTGNGSEIFSEWKDCGHTFSEARSRGCVWDLMLGLWMHESCFNGVMMDRYLRERNHSFFYDRELTREMPEEVARKGELVLWGDAGFHHRHCTYWVDTQVRSYITRRPIPSHLYDYGHTQHCLNYTLDHTVVLALRMDPTFSQCGFPKA